MYSTYMSASIKMQILENAKNGVKPLFPETADIQFGNRSGFEIVEV